MEGTKQTTNLSLEVTIANHWLMIKIANHLIVTVANCSWV